MRLANLTNKRRSFMTTTIVKLTDPHYQYLITGDSGSNTIWGDPYGASKDIIKGLAGNDTLHGGALNDSLEGGSGADVLDGGSGSDYTSYASSPAAVEIHLNPGEAAPHGGDANGDTFTSIENLSGSKFDDNLFGSTGANSLYGNDGNDGLTGGAGTDWLDGGSGGDWLTAGAGVDSITGGTGSDSFYFWTADSGDVNAGQADTIWDFKDEDTIFLNGSYTYAGNTDEPADGQYGIWQKGSAWVVTWNAVNDNGWHDVTVHGDNPAGDISFFP